MQKFKEGQRVKVELEGIIRETESHDGCLRISSQGFSHYVYVNRVTDIPTGAKVTLLDPPDWPPRPGGVTFLELHFCTNHDECKAAAKAAAEMAVTG